REARLQLRLRQDHLHRRPLADHVPELADGPAVGEHAVADGLAEARLDAHAHARQGRGQVGDLDAVADPLLALLEEGEDDLAARQLHVLRQPVGGVHGVEGAEARVVLLEVDGHRRRHDELVLGDVAGGDLPHSFLSSRIRRSLPPAERGAAPGASSVTFTPMPTLSRILCSTSRASCATGSSWVRTPSSRGATPRREYVSWSSSSRSSSSSRVLSRRTTSW